MCLARNRGLFEEGILSAFKNFLMFPGNLLSEFLASQPAFLFRQLQIRQFFKDFCYSYFSGKLWIANLQKRKYSRGLSLIISEAFTWGEWRIQCCSKGFQRTSKQNKENAVINIGLVRLPPPQWPNVCHEQPHSR